MKPANKRHAAAQAAVERIALLVGWPAQIADIEAAGLMNDFARIKAEGLVYFEAYPDWYALESDREPKAKLTGPQRRRVKRRLEWRTRRLRRLTGNRARP